MNLSGLGLLFLSPSPKSLVIATQIMSFIKFINDNISCSHKCRYTSFKMTCLINNIKLISLDDLSLLLLLHLLELFVVRTQISLFLERQRYHLLSTVSFQSPKSFRMTCLIYDEKLISLGGLSLLLLLPLLLFLVVTRFVTFLFIFFINGDILFYFPSHLK